MMGICHLCDRAQDSLKIIILDFHPPNSSLSCCAETPHHMPVNKNAVLRYNTLDKCFSNFGRKYFFEDLLEIVNDALAEEDPDTSGIQIRQLREDVRFMKSEAGYSAPIEAVQDGRKSFYRYSDRSFSINKRPLNSTEAEQIKRAISILQRFEGAPQFEWVRELVPMLNNQFGLKAIEEKVMAFESNIDYTGYEYISPIFNAIINKRVLKIIYHPFDQEAFSFLFHPYFLKQYNNRWFALGYNQDLNFDRWNIALDRIKAMEEVNKKYRKNTTDWDEHFYDIVGVTRLPGEKAVPVELIFQREQAPYIQTKPMHPSQKVKQLKDGRLQVRLHLIPNYELVSQLLSFGEKVEVMSPKSLRTNIRKRLKNALDQY